MRFEHVTRYAAAPTEVHAMLTDAEFRRQVCEAQHALDPAVDVTDRAGVTTVEVARTQSLAGAPTAAIKVVGSSVRIVQRERWTGPTTADLDLEIPGKPGRLRGTIRLVETATGCDERVSGEAKVHVPFVGGKLEQLVCQLLGKALERQARVGERWLAGQQG